MTKAAVRAEAEAIFAAFQAAGAVAVEADILLPAGTLLDLYGEDIRARAYVTSDPLRGEMMLRPDFTVPVVQAHMSEGAEPARYTYMGEVFRRQEHVGPRASEYMQVGFELFDRTEPEAADAEVFALIAGLLAPLDLRAATGDIGILMAAVRGLSTTEKRKAALLRHVWRPNRFRALLDRFAGRMPVPEARLRLLDRLSRAGAVELMEAAGPAIGLREPDEIEARAAALVEDASAAPLGAEETAVLDELLSLEDAAPAALDRLEGLARRMPSLGPSVARFARRLGALSARGIAVEHLPFDASHGQSSLEYYDGFVFSFHAADPALPPVSTGGRYDALTAVLGQGRSIPAVGGVIRPGLVARLKGLA
ncbi:ATP phosphoribosyltransferase regulatory subunit [Cereibacter sediminicola]|uniref:ATP phosphoribosyltransferase regulatory subunit n=1 Tax=Cereibacter sediminicola TaxID=2584941 RepID=UPI00119F889B|nr:ATP phosphoribosyltransferase regulatory subunit [Cereibacter sediminicola]